MTRKAKPEVKPREQMTEAEKLDDWRRKRAAKPLTRPNGKMMGKQKREAKDG